MAEDRLHVLDIGVSVEASARIKPPIQDGDSQLISVCHKNHVIAIANGRFVDLYGICANSLHPFTFLHQISIAVATCVSFPVPGFLLVGAFVETREPPASVQVYFSFVEPVVGADGRCIRSLQSFRHDMTPDAGSVLVLFEDSKVFGVLSWKERFSDRQVCLAQIKQQTGSLVIAQCSQDGRYAVLGDAGGRLSQQLVGKRLELKACSRSGVISRDNPLERVRVAHTLASSGMDCAYTSLRWWMCSIQDQQKQFILAGKQDGSLNVRGCKLLYRKKM
ncbi:uncharacterized protein PITG_00933 [Phytophthora infestans T30-4]|uniref:Cleavage/polyadenylation specificity factor A subunit N-terminal domain-containing protein n=1 Tax=Phytophthora infestans (strain T30-4) TaxID=403677 RepID=D0MS18_PHYIT|nr:uncharacterized protein PITG_00933 [Phytophthora infestans T30-4]EEY58287.1 hypothetical protein PITG_00933 [Phytophthora infestans T30-4]|eukprot:XP_002909473.1 hypothetical protein PITG_00933 [Phytophthora infestans T30-4]